MAQEKQIGEVLQDLYGAKKSGALYISIVEQSEDLFRVYFKDGAIYHIRYGSAQGKDCLDLLEYYTLYSATWFDAITSPGDAKSTDLPSMESIIAAVKRLDKKVKVR